MSSYFAEMHKKNNSFGKDAQTVCNPFRIEWTRAKLVKKCTTTHLIKVYSHEQQVFFTSNDYFHKILLFILVRFADFCASLFFLFVFKFCEEWEKSAHNFFVVCCSFLCTAKMKKKGKHLI